jgi:hypothetical protein
VVVYSRYFLCIVCVMDLGIFSYVLIGGARHFVWERQYFNSDKVPNGTGRQSATRLYPGLELPNAVGSR